MSIHTRQTAKGIRYDVRLRDPSCKPYCRTFNTKKDAQAYEAEQLTARNKGSWIDPRTLDTPFAEVAHRWLQNGTSKRSKTKIRDEGIVRRHLLPPLGARPIGSIRSFDLQALINKWGEAGLSAASITRHKAVLSAIFNLALNDDLLMKSPVSGLRLPRQETKPGRVLTSEESCRLLEVVHPNHYPVIYMLLTTGMRWSELAGLDIRHLDLMGRPSTLTIEQGAHEVAAGIEITPTKSLAAIAPLCLHRHRSRRSLVISNEQVALGPIVTNLSL